MLKSVIVCVYFCIFPCLSIYRISPHCFLLGHCTSTSTQFPVPTHYYCTLLHSHCPIDCCFLIVTLRCIIISACETSCQLQCAFYISQRKLSNHSTGIIEIENKIK